MNKFKGLAAALAAAVLVVPSAFAESRHSNETHGRDLGRIFHHDRGGDSHQSSRSERSETRNFDRGRSNGGERNFDRGRGNNNDRSFNDRSRTFNNNDRSFDRGRSETFRHEESRDNRSFRDNNNRSFHDNRSSRDNRSFDHGRSFDRGRPFFHEGRVSRYEPWNGGYRVWIGGAPYPFFVPLARFRLFPHFHVGLSIRLGGYYNPLGYYDYYDGPYDGGYYDGYSSPAYVRGDLTGIVESVDYRRGTVLVRDRASDRIVSVVMRGDDPQFGDLRIGDYVELSGDWTRIGTFDAYRVYSHDTAGYRYYER